MICRSTHGKDFSGGFRYILKASKKAEIIASTATSNDPGEIAREFAAISLRSTRCTKPVAHYVISPKTGEFLDDESWRKVIAAVVKETGADQYVAVLHHDRGAHIHAHVIMNRIRLTGKAWNDSNERRRMRRVCQRLEDELGLTRTPTRSLSKGPSVTKDMIEMAEREYREGKSPTPIPEKIIRFLEKKTTVHPKSGYNKEEHDTTKRSSISRRTADMDGADGATHSCSPRGESGCPSRAADGNDAPSNPDGGSTPHHRGTPVGALAGLADIIMRIRPVSPCSPAEEPGFGDEWREHERIPHREL